MRKGLKTLPYSIGRGDWGAVSSNVNMNLIILKKILDIPKTNMYIENVR
jgi:hypothetical protein